MILPLQYLKLEEVGEQVRLNQWQIQHRSSLLAVMFHHTVDHEQEASWNGDTGHEDPGVQDDTGGHDHKDTGHDDRPQHGESGLVDMPLTS